MEGNSKICIGIQSQPILILSNYRKCIWRNQGFLKTYHGLLCTTDLAYCSFELVSYSFQRERGKYMNSGRISWLWILIQIFGFQAILPWLPMMQLWAWTPLFNNSNGWKYHGTSKWMRKPQWTIKTYERSVLLRPFWSTHENIWAS